MAQVVGNNSTLMLNFPKPSTLSPNSNPQTQTPHSNPQALILKACQFYTYFATCAITTCANFTCANFTRHQYDWCILEDCVGW